MARPLPFVWLLPLLSAACTVGAGEPVPPVEQPASPYGSDAGPTVLPDPDYDPRENPSPPDSTTPVLTVNPPDTSTYWDLIPLTGMGPPGGILVVETPGQGTLTADISLRGGFCKDVPLSPGVVNEIRLQAQDDQGNWSEPVTITVTQEGEPPEPEAPEQAEPINVAAGAPLHSTSGTFTEGSPTALTDENPGTFAVLESDILDPWPFEDPISLTLELSERARIDRIRFLNTEDCVPEEYRVLVSDVDSPSDPIGDAPGWTEVAHVVAGQSVADKEISFDPLTAQFVGFELRSTECSSYYLYSQYRIREIEAWTVPLELAPAPQRSAPSCRSGVLP